MVGCHELLANIPSSGVITVDREASVRRWVSSLGVEVNETPENQPLAL